MFSLKHHSFHFSDPNPTTMATLTFRTKDWSCFAVALLFLPLFIIFWCFAYPFTITNSYYLWRIGPSLLNCAETDANLHNQDHPYHISFYDDPELSYSVENRITNWDDKRKHWLEHHPSYSAGARDRVLLVTGSQPSPCKNPIGDHLLLRLFKNKVDYCRIHGYDIFYNHAFLHPKMDSYWAKLPIIRAAMMAHPEAEWIWWMDSDAAFTDMEFKIPLERYDNHNLVVHGWPNMVYNDKDNKSWTGLNAGVILIRNCQWSMDLINVWAKMGPNSPNYEKWGQILRATFKDKPFRLPDDQSSLIYLLFTQREKWESKTYLEGEYYLEAYWIGVVGSYDNITEGYTEIEKGTNELRRRHAEKDSEWYAELREARMKNETTVRRPFVTHFTGCQPCSGEHNPMYSGDSCWNQIRRALNFADNQVLRNYGFVHTDLDSSSVTSMSFDYPSSDGSS